MQIVDFTAGHIEAAKLIARQNYETERGHVPALPLVDEMPSLTPFVKNGLGVAAVDDRGGLIGFLCGRKPWNGAFGIPGLRHIYSPMGANGTVAEDRAKIYARLYQAAGAKWARAGAVSHGVCLYAHDAAGQARFFNYGFGKRTVDAIRGMDEIAAPPCDGYNFSEFTPDDLTEIHKLINELTNSYIDSPFFMFREPESESEFLASCERYKTIFYIAKHYGKPIAFICAESAGETFIKNTPGYLHCNGLYCLPEHRGKGISQNLLNMLVQKLKTQGYTSLGVDFESINPSGSGFWHKYFDAYTYGVVRRIDEGAIQKYC